MEFIEAVKEFFNKLDKQKLILFGSIIGVMVAIIITISIVVKIVGVRISYEKLEEKLEVAAEKYMADYPNNLPTKENPVTVVSATTLIQDKYIKELKKYVKDSSCTANVNVYWNEGKYRYQTYLTCNEFKTQMLIDEIKNSNKISSFGEGLYEMNGELVYRGENPNNYIKFADELWRIVKINNKGQFILIKNDLESENYGVWDDRYNTESDSIKGINNFSLSRALSTIRTIYQEKYAEETELTTFDICVGKRYEFDMSKDGSAECSNVLANQNIGLLPVYDYMNASLDGSCVTISNRECQNYNYLVNDEDKWWTVTGDNSNTYDVYYISYSGQIEVEEAAVSANYRYTVALNENVLFKSGSGTENDPYEIR